jgi:hypothetical protein
MWDAERFDFLLKTCEIILKKFSDLLFDSH